MAQLPIGAVAGIVIGAAVGGLLLFVITIWWCCWCRRKARSRRKGDLEQSFDLYAKDSDLVVSRNVVVSHPDANGEVHGMELQSVALAQGLPDSTGAIRNGAKRISEVAMEKTAAIMRWLDQAQAHTNADGGDSDLPPGEPLEERRRSIGGRLAGALGALNPQRFTAGGGGGVPLSELKGKLLSRVGMYPGDSARYPLDVKGIVFNRLPPSVRGSPAPSTIDTSASRARTIRTVINDQDGLAVGGPGDGIDLGAPEQQGLQAAASSGTPLARISFGSTASFKGGITYTPVTFSGQPGSARASRSLARVSRTPGLETTREEEPYFPDPVPAQRPSVQPGVSTTIPGLPPRAPEPAAYQHPQQPQTGTTVFGAVTTIPGMSAGQAPLPPIQSTADAMRAFEQAANSAAAPASLHPPQPAAACVHQQFTGSASMPYQQKPNPFMPVPSTISAPQHSLSAVRQPEPTLPVSVGASVDGPPSPRSTPLTAMPKSASSSPAGPGASSSKSASASPSFGSNRQTSPSRPAPILMPSQAYMMHSSSLPTVPEQPSPALTSVTIPSTTGVTSEAVTPAQRSMILSMDGSTSTAAGVLPHAQALAMGLSTAQQSPAPAGRESYFGGSGRIVGAAPATTPTPLSPGYNAPDVPPPTPAASKEQPTPLLQKEAITSKDAPAVLVQLEPELPSASLAAAAAAALADSQQQPAAPAGAIGTGGPGEQQQKSLTLVDSLSLTSALPATGQQQEPGQQQHQTSGVVLQGSASHDQEHEPQSPSSPLTAAGSAGTVTLTFPPPPPNVSSPEKIAAAAAAGTGSAGGAPPAALEPRGSARASLDAVALAAAAQKAQQRMAHLLQVDAQEPAAKAGPQSAVSQLSHVHSQLPTPELSPTSVPTSSALHSPTPLTSPQAHAQPWADRAHSNKEAAAGASPVVMASQVAQEQQGASEQVAAPAGPGAMAADIAAVHTAAREGSYTEAAVEVAAADHHAAHRTISAVSGADISGSATPAPVSGTEVPSGLHSPLTGSFTLPPESQVVAQPWSASGRLSGSQMPGEMGGVHARSGQLSRVTSASSWSVTMPMHLPMSPDGAPAPTSTGCEGRTSLMGTHVSEMEDAEEEAVKEESMEPSSVVAEPQQEHVVAQTGSPAHARVKEISLGGGAPFVVSPDSSNTPSVHVSIGGAVPEKGVGVEE